MRKTRSPSHLDALTLHAAQLLELVLVIETLRFDSGSLKIVLVCSHVRFGIVIIVWGRYKLACTHCVHTLFIGLYIVELFVRKSGCHVGLMSNSDEVNDWQDKPVL
jgi:hypothetical protein